MPRDYGDDRYDDDPTFYIHEPEHQREEDAEDVAAARERRVNADAEATARSWGYSPMDDSWGMAVARARGEGI